MDKISEVFQWALPAAQKKIQDAGEKWTTSWLVLIELLGCAV